MAERLETAVGKESDLENVVHVIDSLIRGGAETLLTDLLPQLSKHYNVILVTLTGENEFGETVYQHCSKHYCLNHEGYLSLPRTIGRLRKIIKEHHPVLVRSQLIWSSIITRLACPKNIPLVFSVHITMEVFSETILGPVLAMAEKMTLSNRQIMVGVTRQVVDGYSKKFGFKGSSFVLYNYVRKEFFAERNSHPANEALRLVAVGNLRAQKNYQYLIDAFKLLKGKNISLDIFGAGTLYQTLDEQIKQHSLPIQLKGKSGDIPQLMKAYDGFVMVSSFEGFGIVVAEAMAAGLPLILSDIPVLREVSEGNAFFIDIASPKNFADLMNSFLTKEKNTGIFLENNRQTVNEKYTQRVYLQNLLKIYEEATLPPSKNSEL